MKRRILWCLIFSFSVEKWNFWECHSSSWFVSLSTVYLSSRLLSRLSSNTCDEYNHFVSFWSIRSKLRRSTFVFFWIFWFELNAMTNNVFLFMTVIALYICFIYTKTIIVRFFIFFVNIEIANCCLSIIECVSVVRKIFVLFLK